MFYPPIIHLAIFASGSGSNAEKIMEHFAHHSTIKVRLIVCNVPGAGVIERAHKFDVPVLMITKDDFFKTDHYVANMKEAKIDFIALAGFLWKVPQNLVEAFRGRIVNIHPALLPKYGGKGMYGMKVHEAVIEAGEKESGITIHYVDEHYDNGDIIFQATCPVEADDRPEELAERIHALEHENYPVVIENVIVNIFGNSKFTI